MKKLLLFLWTFSIVLSGCKKNDSTQPSNQDNLLSDNAIIVSGNVINSSLIAVDSTKLTFTAAGSGVDKVKVGSILVSDVSAIAPIGFLRKITAISTVGSNIVCTTEQAALTDAIVKGKVTYNRAFTDNDIIGEDSSGVDISAQQRIQGLSFTFNYNNVLYDADGNNSTTFDQIKIKGEMKIEPTFDFELDIDGSSVKRFVAKINLKNTNKISAESKVVLASFNKEVVLKTFQLRPFTILIAGVPVPIAKQWIAIVIGVDGSLTAKVTAGAENINTAVAGISYENNSWNTINTLDNSFTLQPLTFTGSARVEPWLQARYEIRPYGIRESRIYIGVRGSVIGEATIVPTGLSTTLKWGVKFSAKAQMQIFNRAVLDYERIFFEREYLISQSIAILPSPEALWSFDDCTANDFSGNNHNGRFFGVSPTCQTGISSNSWFFNNNTLSYFDSPWDLAINKSSFSISFWVKFLPPTTFSSTTSSPFFTLESGDLNSFKHLHFYNRFNFSNPSLTYWAITTWQNGGFFDLYTNTDYVGLTNGSWRHFALSCTNDIITLYLDGNALGNFLSPSTTYHRIMAQPDPQKNAGFDQIHYYNTALSATQIQYIYNNHL
jgi:Concanavalin A-like lectin/glucanases superfamily